MKTKKKNILVQLLLSTTLIVSVSLFSFFLLGNSSYKIVALVLLMCVALIAVSFDFIPVIYSAVLSSLIWNFFFIPPIFTFHISNAEDILMFVMYFVVAFVHAFLTYKIKQAEKKAREKEEKEKVIQLYNTLLNSLSHELRTPIATIIGSVDFLKEKKNLSFDEQAAIYNELEIASTRLNKQVQNLLSMSRLDSGTIATKLDWIDVNDVINKVLNEFQELKDKKICVLESMEDLPLYKTDGALLEQIIYNLIHNAVEHTPHNTIISIEVHEDDQKLEITIEDNGKGFPEEELDKVFDKFYRLPRSKTGGVGLGLSIVKGFTEALNGKIVLENKTKGARFTVEIPCETSYINRLTYDD